MGGYTPPHLERWMLRTGGVEGIVPDLKFAASTVLLGLEPSCLLAGNVFA